MNSSELFKNIKAKKSFLCVGLDTDINKIPEHLKNLEDPLFEFNKQIIDKTYHTAVAYKPNLAFYESYGVKGWQAFEKTVAYIKKNHPDILIIADAKRGDIGNTSKMYASAFFDNMDVDAITVAPYMGEDSVSPFLSYDGKWVILLALTSNKGAFNFQFFKEKGQYLFENVLKTAQAWGNKDNMMFVVGATKAEMLESIRKIVPNHFLLVPGVGAQGGSLSEVARFGMNANCGLLVNSSRAIIYADTTEEFADVAKIKAEEVQQEMTDILTNAGLVK